MTISDEQYLTVLQAAALLNVSKSTLWRWINQGDLPAHRVGYRRVMIKQDDLNRMISPARPVHEDPDWEKERQRLSRPLTEEQKAKALAALDAARELRNELFARSGGQLFSDSTEIIRAMREDRTKQLDDLR